MRVYHGSGFYTTTSYKQAEEWVRKRMEDSGVAKGFVNEYELDLDKLASYKCLLTNICCIQSNR